MLILPECVSAHATQVQQITLLFPTTGCYQQPHPVFPQQLLQKHPLHVQCIETSQEAPAYTFGANCGLLMSRQAPTVGPNGVDFLFFYHWQVQQVAASYKYVTCQLVCVMNASVMHAGCR